MVAATNPLQSLIIMNREYRVLNRQSNKKIVVHSHETILAAALRQQMIVPYGCQNGACGSCKAELISGSVDYGEVQPQALSKNEQAQGKVLLCKAIPLEDLEISAMELAADQQFAIKTTPARVSQLDKLAHDVMQLTLKLPPKKNFKYLPGQYIDILLSGGKRRSFSLASPSAHNDELQLHVRYVANGEFSDFVFSKMQPKTLLRLQGPLGTFFLREDSNRPIIMVAGGTGFAPIKAMLEAAFKKGIERPLHFFWGVRTEQDLYLKELPDLWDQKYKNFQYTPVLSDGLPGDQWRGESGWVHEAVVKHYPVLDRHEIYAAGPPPMIDAGQSEFSAHGMSLDNYFFDSFDYANQTDL